VLGKFKMEVLPSTVEAILDQAVGDDIDAADLEVIAEKILTSSADPPGMAIGTLALLDGLVLFTVVLMGLTLLVPERVHGRVQGVVSLIVSVVVAIVSIVVALAAFTKTMLMIALVTASPFGTAAYLATWGFFDRGGAGVALSLIMGLKLGFAVCLVLAQQRFLQVKGLVLIVLTSLLANVIISTLHGIVPIPLVSITDAIAAIIVAIIALIWAIVLLVFSIVSIVKAIA